MQIAPYERGMAEPLALLYNRLVVDIPHCCPISAEMIDRGLSGELGTPRSPRFRDRQTLVVLEAGSLVGAVHLGVAVATDSRPAEGRIAFFAQERGHRGAGQALLQAAEARLRDLGVRRVVAFHADSRCPFYHLENAYLSDRMEHIHALYGLNGYERVAGGVFMHWRDFRPPVPGPAPAGVEVSIKWEQRDLLRPALTVQAHRDGGGVGTCKIKPCGEANAATATGVASDRELAEIRDWCLVDWLGVREPLQGQGLGRHLLQRGLAEVHAIGYRHAAISTAWNNWRAMALYGNYGFRAVDWTYGLARELL